jgi:hypothetical protein
LRRTVIASLALLGLVGITLWLGHATFTGIEWLRGLVLAAWIGLLGGVVWWLSRPVSSGRRLMVWALFVGLLLGMLAPPDWLHPMQDWVAGWLGLVADMTLRDSGPAFVHFGVFAAFTMLLFWARADFQLTPFLLPLAGFAVATELMQFLVDGRQPDPFDVVLNLAGIGTAALAAWGVSRMRIRRADS